MDGNFKARHLKSAGTEGRDALEGADSALFIPYSKVKEKVERPGESDVKVDCTSVFVVDNENAKRSAQYFLTCRVFSPGFAATIPSSRECLCGTESARAIHLRFSRRLWVRLMIMG